MATKRVKAIFTGEDVLWVTCPICGKSEFGIETGKSVTRNCYGCVTLQITRTPFETRISFTPPEREEQK